MTDALNYDYDGPLAVSKRIQFIVVSDGSWPLDELAKAYAGAHKRVALWVKSKGWGRGSAFVGVKKTSKSSKKQNSSFAHAFAEFFEQHAQEIHEENTYFIVGAEDPQVCQDYYDSIRNFCTTSPILRIGARETKSAFTQNKKNVSWRDLLPAAVDSQLQHLSFQDQIKKVRDYFKGASNIAFLLQDDPDPDGIASALALRKLLGRNSQTSIILTFGKITRPENIAMVKLLDIEVVSVLPEALSFFDKIVMVDCQPSFFKNLDLRVDALFDHHPRVTVEGQPAVPVEIIREDLGATSTLLTHYFLAAGVEINQRLATALLYGIKSDTLLLNREVSPLDLDAFMTLYPKINTSVLRRIERPELSMSYLAKLSEALKYLDVKEEIAVLPMGSVDQEDWIPHAADFAMQVEGVKWALGCGLYENKLVISGRNCGYVQHCGELFKTVFGSLGSAGGHRTMAKAVIEISEWNKTYPQCRLNSVGDVSRQLLSLLIDCLQTKGMDKSDSHRAGAIV